MLNRHFYGESVRHVREVRIYLKNNENVLKKVQDSLQHQIQILQEEEKFPVFAASRVGGKVKAGGQLGGYCKSLGGRCHQFELVTEREKDRERDESDVM